VAIIDQIGVTPDIEPAVQVGLGALGTVIAFGDALRRRDPGSAYAWLESGAHLLTAGGTEVSDPESIGSVLAVLTAPRTRLDIVPGRTLAVGDVALCTQAWRLRPASADPCFDRARCAFFVLRRTGGRWRIAIAAPWG
jgi:hypothetical protein